MVNADDPYKEFNDIMKVKDKVELKCWVNNLAN